LADIGYALGNLCRYAGHTGWWSVAQHSLLVAWLAEPKDKLRALLHDASEAFLVDVPGPLKRMECMAGYRELESKVMRAIHRQFGIPEDVEAEKRVKQADILAYEMESKYLGRGNGYSELSLVIPEEIRRMNRAESQYEFERMAIWLMSQ
jgi:5'-deoxynucleotidase YfbR-like HD superfamily hydrolase